MSKSFLQDLIDKGSLYIDYGMAWKGALGLGLIVYAINYSHGPLAALPAALKQASYTFFVAGFIVKLSENLLHQISLAWLAFVTATAIPALIAIGLTYLLHSLKGTPEPFFSTLPTIIMAPPAFAVITWRNSIKNQTVHMQEEQ